MPIGRPAGVRRPSSAVVETEFGLPKPIPKWQGPLLPFKPARWQKVYSQFYFRATAASAGRR